jgi:hypothetical protein
MKPLTIFGLVAVTPMLVSYALEKRSHWFILAFAGSCVLGSAYGFLQGAWPFGIVEAIWALVALQRCPGPFLIARAFKILPSAWALKAPKSPTFSTRTDFSSHS